jgi:hypothetical protein
MLVAEYVGRPNTSDDYNRNMEMLAELYSAEIGYENEVTEVASYFAKRNKSHFLAQQPDNVIAAHIINSKVKRISGVHMVEKLKDAGEKYIKAWLLRERDFDEDGNKLTNINTIFSPALLEELIYYNRKGNFDRVMALMILMLFIENDDTIYDAEPAMSPIGESLQNFTKNLFKRKS